MTITKERYAYLDLMKSIAIFFVLFYHNFFVNTDILTSNDLLTYLNYFLEAILSCCVPLFFFVNGALLLNKGLDIKKHVRKIALITALTVIWAMITVILLMFIKGEFLSIKESFIAIATWKGGWTNHLWFMSAIVVIYIFFPLIKSAYDYNRDYFMFFLIAAAVFTFGNTLLCIGANIVEAILHINYLKENINFFNVFNALRGIHGYAIVYFMIGGLAFANKEKIASKCRVASCLLTVFCSMLLLMCYGILMSTSNGKMYDIVYDGYDTVFTLVNVMIIFKLSLAFNGNGKIGKFIKIVGESSLAIYFIHIPLGRFLELFNIKALVSVNIIANAAYAFVLLMLSLALSVIFKKVPIIKKLFSI